MKNIKIAEMIMLRIAGYSGLLLGIFYHNGIEKIIFSFLGIILLLIYDIKRITSSSLIEVKKE